MGGRSGRVKFFWNYRLDEASTHGSQSQMHLLKPVTPECIDHIKFASPPSPGFGRYDNYGGVADYAEEKMMNQTL
jgi:hypothetical protein